MGWKRVLFYSFFTSYSVSFQDFFKKEVGLFEKYTTRKKIENSGPGWSQGYRMPTESEFYEENIFLF